VVEPDDWRLQGQERYLADRELEWSQWTAKREEWDHDHCEFCWAKFGPVGASARRSDGLSPARAAERWAIRDDLAMLHQLGALPNQLPIQR
jgi:hypothetical protein